MSDSMRALLGIRRSALAITLTLSGCFAVVDVDHFHTATAGSPDASAPDVLAAPDVTGSPTMSGEYLSLKLSLIGMTPHLKQLFEYRIIDGNNFIQSRGVVNPLGAPDVIINAPLAIPKVNGPFHLDFYADVDNSGGYNGIGSVLTQDHAWRIDPLRDYPDGTVTPVDGLVQVTFTHNTSFTPIEDYPSGTPNAPRDTTLGATVQVRGADGLQGRLIQVRIVDAGGTNHTVGLFRVPQITGAAFNMSIPGVVENMQDYNVLIYVDANNNGIYDNPALGLGDLGWSKVGTADTTGLTVILDAQNTTAATVDVGAP
jgi:hypothetical protein